MDRPTRSFDSPATRARLAIATRIFSASLGGYLLASAAAFALARGLPLSRAEATTAASLAAILVMPAAAIWAFAAQRAWRAIADIVGLAALLGCIAWLLGRPA